MNLVKPILLVSFVMLFSNLVSAMSSDSTGSSIEFGSFEVRLSSRVVHIHFKVKAETQGAFFVVEKSVDEESWSSVTTLSSKSDHSDEKTYETSTIDFAEGVIEYYRLIRVDKQGDTTELGQDIIRREALKNMQLVPVKGKAHKEVYITFDSMIANQSTITVMRRDGTIIQEIDYEISEGYNRYKLNIKNFEGGDYLVKVKDLQENKISKRLVIYR